MKLELRGITKRFGALVANDNINLVVNPGEIVSLLGENGAGKSTLMNVLYGLYNADGGQILIDDQPVTFKGPGDAMASGIGMVHQHFMLIPVFTVAENVALGNEPTGFAGSMDLDAARARVREISDRFGFNVDPDALVQDIPVGVQQRVEIIKALSRDAKVLVLDEPTAVLTPQETDELMSIMRELAKAGTSIIFITHKLREVQAVADRIVVIRLGKVVGEASPTASASELASLMVGREVDLGVQKNNAKPGDVVLSLEDISVIDDRGQLAVDHVSLEVRSGEVLAIAGVQGNGQTELAEAIVGLRKLVRGQGSIKYRGQSIEHKSVRNRLDEFLSYVPEDRKKDGLVTQFTIEENLMLNQSFGDAKGAQFVKRGLIDVEVLRTETEHAIESFDIRTQSRLSTAGQLSGGNQQKVVLAREMSRPHSVLLVSQPTRGVDVGSIEFIHDRIIHERDKEGAAIILISTELDEVLALADRIAVMYRGKVVGIVSAQTSRETLGKMMAGVAA
ncbi:MAG: ABC transporter ATP-binding protein [Microbacteriaceae bacterium]